MPYESGGLLVAVGEGGFDVSEDCITRSSCGCWDVTASILDGTDRGIEGDDNLDG